MGRKRRFELFFLSILGVICFGGGDAYAGNASAAVSIDSTQILIGEQTLFHINLSFDQGDEVEMPIFCDTIAEGMEIVSVGKCDTILSKKGRGEVKQDLLLTSFQEGLHHIKPLSFVVNGDTIYSNGVGLKVITYDIDTTDTRIFDIKPILKAPFVWKDYLSYVWITLLLLLLGFAFVYFYKRWKEHKSLLGAFKKEEPVRPPFEVAMEELERIQEEKIYLNHREKDFYTQLTDVLRIYIRGRFGVNAMEMTSAEILEAMHSVQEAKEVFEKLKQILLLADFVKFAKIKPAEFENESSMTNALLFVKNTEPIPEPTEEEKLEEGKEEKK